MAIYPAIERSEWASERLMREIERTPLAANVGALLDDAAERWRDRPFLVFFDDDDTLSYADVARHVRHAAGALAAIGVGTGTHVAVMLPTARTWPITWLALARLGAVTIPINYNYTPRELAWMLDDSDASHLVIHRDYLSVLESIEGGAPLARGNVVVAGGAAGYPHHLERMMDAGHRTPTVEVDRDALMNIQYTSGTTGLPKGAMLTHRYWLTFGRNGAAQFQDSLERILISQPYYYVDGQWLTLVTLYQGATAYVARRMHSSRFLDWLRTWRISYCNFPEVVAKQPESPDDRMDHLVALSCYSHRKDNYAMYERRFGAPARQGFSMTELGCAIHVPMEAHAMTGTGTVGVPVAFREAMVADAAGVRVKPGEYGELCVRGAGIFEGYYRRPEASAAAFRGDWFRTGDVACEDETGWFFYLGRMKDLVRRSSENVSAVEVEGVLRGADGVLESAVVPVPDELRGEEVKGVSQARSRCGAGRCVALAGVRALREEPRAVQDPSLRRVRRRVSAHAEPEDQEVGVVEGEGGSAGREFRSRGRAVAVDCGPCVVREGERDPDRSRLLCEASRRVGSRSRAKAVRNSGGQPGRGSSE